MSNENHTRKLTKITLYQSVPFDKTYKHIVNWQDEAPYHTNLDKYLNHFFHIELNGSYQNLNKPIRWATNRDYTGYYTEKEEEKTEERYVNFNELMGFNYCRIDNTDSNTGQAKSYYAFITNFEYYNDGCAFIYFSIDNWNTYQPWVNLNSSRGMIQRGFVQELTEDGQNFTNMFNRVKNMPDEIGGDGCDYLQESAPIGFQPDNKDNIGQYVTSEFIQFVLFTVQPKDAKTDFGTAAGIYSQYKYYFFAYRPADYVTLTIKAHGETLVEGGKTVAEVYKGLADDADLVGTDSLVVDSEVYDYLGLPFEFADDFHTIELKGNKDNFKIEKGNDYLAKINVVDLTIFKPQTGYLIDGTNINFSNHESALVTLQHWFRAKYGTYCPLKLMGAPFTKLYITDGKGLGITADLLKYSTLTDNYLTIKRYGALSENGHQTYALNGFNRASTFDQSKFVTYENAYGVDDAARDVPIVLDSYTMFINANKNQLANVRANAKMNLKLAKQGNLISLQNTNRSLNTQNAVAGYQASRNNQMAGTMAGLGILTGAASGAMHGGLIGGVMGGLGGAVTGGINMYKTAYAGQTATTATGMQTATAAQNARANYAYQNEVATNNYEQTIRSQNAMLADTKNHNDQIAHQGSDYALSLQLGNNGPHWQIFTCQDNVMQNAALFFSLFGYEVNQYGTIADWLKVRYYFNYVKTSNVNINGNIPSFARDTLEQMFDNGVTVWNITPTDKYLYRFTIRDQQSDNPFNSLNPFD